MKTAIGLGIIALVLLFIFSPFLTIWALNTLFPVLSIPYTLDTYFAALLLNGLVGSTHISSRD